MRFLAPQHIKKERDNALFSIIILSINCDKILTMSRPEFLYRGTPSRDTALFTPKEFVGSGSSVKLVVSATSDRNIATRFIVPMEGLEVKTGFIEGVPY